MIRLLPDLSGDWKKKLKEGFLKRLNAMLVFVLACSIGLYFGKYFILLEWMCHFRAQYFWIGVIGVLGLAYTRNWKWVAVPALIVFINAPGVLGWYFGKPKVDSGEETRIRFFLANVQYSRVDHRRLIEQIQRERADIVVLEEVQWSLVQAMEVLHNDYTYRLVLPRDDAFGIAVYSKLPLVDLKDIYYGKSDVPTITGTLMTKSGYISFFASHPLPPGKLDYFAGRNEHLKLMAADIATRKGRIVLIGDLNVTPWSPYYQDFVDETHLLNARKGFGLQPSWPTVLPPLMIPIDQFLYSKGMNIRECHTGSRTGSDHLPLVVELSVPRK